MKASLTRRLICMAVAATIAFALGAGAFVPMPVAHAETRSGHAFTYYNNAAHQTVVGYYVYCNNGNFIHWGEITPYDTISASGC